MISSDNPDFSLDYPNIKRSLHASLEPKLLSNVDRRLIEDKWEQLGRMAMYSLFEKRDSKRRLIDPH